jgi:hypothetical protein
MRAFLLLLSAFLLFAPLRAQVPQGIQFQAIARDGLGTPLPSTSLDIRFTLRDPGNAVVYQETHTVITDIFGLFEAVIGAGSPVLGTFPGIDWSLGQYSVDLEVDSGSGYVNAGNTPLQSVPYALYAKSTPGSWEEVDNGFAYNQGRVGIGRSGRLGAGLHLADTTNVLFGDSLSGSGFKLIWYAAKGALRFGYLNNPFGGYNYNKFWDYDSVGFYSFAGGQNSRAKGFGSFAWGSFGWADGSGSVAFFGNARGNNSYTFGGSSRGRGSFTVEGTAEEEGGIAMYGYTGGRYGVSIGGGNPGLGASAALEDYAVAIGWNSDARGQASIALGPSDAYGYNSFSTGWVTEARGNYSSTFGYQTNSYPYASMALGRYNVITGDSASWVGSDPIFMIGDGTTNTNRSNSFTILKNGSTSIGYDSPTGRLQVAPVSTGLNNGGTLDATRATLLLGTSGTGMAFDENQIESIGSRLNLNYNSSEDIALAYGGGAVGIGTIAPATRLDLADDGWQFRIQNTNTGSGGDDWFIGSTATTWAAGGGKFVISPNSGSGNSVFVIDPDLQVGIGTLDPSDRLHIEANAGEDAMRVQINGATRFRVHDNGGVSIGANSAPPAAGLVINGTTHPVADNSYDMGTGTRRWRRIYATNGTIQTSDLRWKEQVLDLDHGLEVVKQLRPVRYHWKNSAGEGPHLGLIAQELIREVPEAVSGDPEADSPMGVNYAELVPVLIKALQEQQSQIEALQQEVENLKKEKK